jgi:hypothetical protein
MTNQDITRSIIRQLAQEKLDFKVPVHVSRDYIQHDERAYVQVLQDKQFKFHILCEPTDASLTETEDMVSDELAKLGYKVDRRFLN